MASGGYRPGAGRPPKPKLPAKLPPPELPPPSPNGEAVPQEKETPLDYMLRTMRDPKADQARRDRMAIAAAPFLHGRVGEEAAGKREKDAVHARRSASGRYEPPAPPRLVISNDGGK